MAATDTKKPDRAGYAKGASKEGAASDEKFDPSKGFDDFAESAEKRANCFSRMIFWYVGQVLEVGAATTQTKGGMDHSDLWRMMEQDQSGVVLEEFAKHWKAEEEKVKASEEYQEAVAAGTPLPKVHFYNVLKRQFMRQMVIAGIFKFFNDVSQFAWPYLLLRFLEFLENLKDRRDRGKSDDVTEGWILCCVLLALMMAKTVLENNYFHKVFRVGMHVRSVCIGLVYDKSLRLSQVARQAQNTGAIVNYMQLDAMKLLEFCQNVHVVWSGLFQIVGFTALLVYTIGPSTFVGIALLILLIPVQFSMYGKLSKHRKMLNKTTDERIKLTNEMLQGIKSIKMYGWEHSFIETMAAIRKVELSKLKTMAYVQAANGAIFFTAPAIIAVVTFAVYTIDNEMTASKAFTAVMLFGMLRLPLMFYPMTLMQFVSAKESWQRINNFASLDEIQADYYTANSSCADGKVLSGASSAEAADSAGGVELTEKPAREGEEAEGEAVMEIKGSSFSWAATVEEKETEEDAAKKAEEAAEEEKIEELEHEAEHEQEMEGGAPEEAVDDAAEEPLKVAEEGAVEGDDGEPTKPPMVLNDVNLRVSKGELVAVVGKVGSGKTALCSAFLGELKKWGGEVTMKGSVAYIAQTPWILNETLRENVVFGGEWNEEQYRRAIKASCLEHDLETLPNNDSTEIGERGINLSGGQKARVSIARAVYSQADTLIFDDPLSALDAEVGHRVFDELILKELSGKTRLLVTNQLWCLERCDRVVVLGEDQRIAQQGTFQELMDSELNFSDMMKEFGVEDDVEEGEVDDDEATLGVDAKAADETQEAEEPGSPKSPKSPAKRARSRSASMDATEKAKADELKKTKGKLSEKEDREKGAVGGDTYTTYVAKAGSKCLFIAVISSLVVQQIMDKVHSYWVAYWSDNLDEEDLECWEEKQAATDPTDVNCKEFETHSIGFYLGIYAAMAISIGLFGMVRSMGFAVIGIRSSNSMHDMLFANVLRAPMSWFDTTPLGRIVNRFSGDVDKMDVALPESIQMFLWIVAHIFFIGVIMIWTAPVFIAAVIPLTYIYVRAVNYFRKTNREVKRLDAISKSPIYAHFSETLNGLPTIRAYKDGKRLSAKIRGLVDYNHMAYWTMRTADRWLATRLETIGNLLVFTNAILLVATSKDITPSLAGLSMGLCMQATGLLNWLVRCWAEVEANMASVERILHFTNGIPQEAKDDFEGSTSTLDPAWPSKGAISFKGYNMRYRTGLDLVLKDLDIDIAPGEKIGVCGRTGSGKSSMLVSILRLVEAAEPWEEKGEDGATMAKTGGSIVVDGVELGSVSLRALRNRISIIPQDSVLFSGDFRFNVDPFHEHSDEDLRAALAKVGMLEVVDELGGLSCTVAEYGENFSVGQRQLVCLARAMLRRTKLLLMDEATASIDFKTDQMIQDLIRTEFTDCTTLTVAHRLNTIIDSDRVLVLDDGRVSQFDSPHNLLSAELGEGKDRNIFRSLVEETGAASATALKEQAAAAAASSPPPAPAAEAE